MAKRNTVRINMDLLDGYLKAKNIHPKDFCEKQLGFSDGWYYGIRKKGGRGVKVLVAQLIARIIGVEYETLVIPEEDTGRKTAAGASPRPTETREERGTGNPSPTVDTGDKRKHGALEIGLDELIPIMIYDLLREEVDAEFVKGYLTALGSIYKYCDIRKEMEKNA